MRLIQALFDTINRRVQPEDVLDIIRKDESLFSFTPDEKHILDHAPKRPAWWQSSMNQDFWKPATMNRQVRVAQSLIPNVAAPTGDSAPSVLAGYVRGLCEEIKAKPDHLDFKADRLDKTARRKQLAGMSRRQYNKRFRLLQRMERKAQKLHREWDKAELLQEAKSRLATHLTLEDIPDLDTAAFVAYFTATLNRRSVFTAGKQESAYDKVADVFLARLKNSRKRKCWWAAAHVLTDADVITRLTDDQKGRLLGLWHAVLVKAAALLKGVNTTCAINRKTMVVKKGNDSSTWNAAAGAWNKCREGYVSVIHALGAERLWQERCLGKVPRLMAGDVTSWHMSKGDEVCHPDVKVWAELPPPWEVLAGETQCTQADVEAACAKHGVDPVKSAWTSPRVGDREAVAFAPTPELVHGVAVTSPALAMVLRKAGCFSGKGGTWVDGVEVVRDDDGYALTARPQVTPAETKQRG